MIKVVSTLKPINVSKIISVGTHNGIFHSDEVVACAILYLLRGKNEDLWILRSRDSEELKKCDIVVDVGGGPFDHHMSGFNQRRENGAMYASAGLIWKRFGYRLAEEFKKTYFPDYEIDLDEVVEKFDNEVISVVDREDNGVDCSLRNPFSFIPSFRPLWFESTPEDFNKKFKEALETAVTVFEEELKSCIAEVLTKKILWDAWLDTDKFHDGILEIPAQSMDWVDTVIGFNYSTPCEFARINFVMFPYPAGGWAAQCVPPSFDDKFGQRIPFPKTWAGATEALPALSGVSSARFCHNGCFFVRATSKEGVTKLCQIASGID